MVCSKDEGEALPWTPWPIGHASVLPHPQGYSPSCVLGYVSSSPLGTSMGPIPSLTFPID